MSKGDSLAANFARTGLFRGEGSEVAVDISY
jgi:hypothetical protein